MAKYRVLPSTAHNYGASFISVMNMASDDYAMCYLVRATENGASTVEIDLLSGRVAPDNLPEELMNAISGYVAGFGAHVQRSGAALDMLSGAVMQIRVGSGRVLGQP